jgi:hypothetical protein
MKPLISFILGVFFSINVTAQQEFMMGITANKFNVDTKNSSNMGYGFIMSYNKIYIDLAGNFASGKGEYLEFSSGSTYQVKKVSALAFNFGYIVKYKKVALIPVIGYGSIGDIYQDPVGWDTYYIVRKSHINAGVIGRINVGERIAIHAGYGVFDGVKFGISYNLINDYSN